MERVLVYPERLRRIRRRRGGHCAARSHEEPGLLVELGPLFGVYSYFDDPRQDGIIVLYRALVVGGALEAGDDAAEVAFFADSALPPADEIGFATHRRALRECHDEIVSGRMAPFGRTGVLTLRSRALVEMAK